MAIVEVRTRPRVTSNSLVREIFRDGHPFSLGGVLAELTFLPCTWHGERSPHLSGYNQGGYDCVSFCLECCRGLFDDSGGSPDMWVSILSSSSVRPTVSITPGKGLVSAIKEGFSYVPGATLVLANGRTYSKHLLMHIQQEDGIELETLKSSIHKGIFGHFRGGAMMLCSLQLPEGFIWIVDATEFPRVGYTIALASA